MRVGILVIARTGSSRLPNKMLSDVAGKPLLTRVIERLHLVNNSQVLILATTCLPEDDELSDLARVCGAEVYRGAVGDVIERKVGACQTFGVDFAIIAEADNPFHEPSHIDRAIKNAVETGVDFVTVSDLPIGSWVKGVKRTALERVYSTKGDQNTEVFTRFFTENPEFSIQTLPADPDLPRFDPELRLTIDYQEDLDLLRMIYDRLSHCGDSISLHEVLSLMVREPELLKINSFLNEIYWERAQDRLELTPEELKNKDVDLRRK